MTTITAQVRKILRESGVATSEGIYSNRYKSSRTLKCYITSKNKKLIENAQSLIEKHCAELDIPVAFKVIKNTPIGGWAPSPSFIVRLPLEDK